VPFERVMENTEERSCEFERQRKKKAFTEVRVQSGPALLETQKYGPTPEVPGSLTTVAVALCYFAGMLSNFPEPSS
jgi:hypothetical protein